MKKKILAIIVILAMTMCMLPTMAFAADEEAVENSAVLVASNPEGAQAEEANAEGTQLDNANAELDGAEEGAAPDSASEESAEGDDSAELQAAYGGVAIGGQLVLAYNTEPVTVDGSTSGFEDIITSGTVTVKYEPGFPAYVTLNDATIVAPDGSPAIESELNCEIKLEGESKLTVGKVGVAANFKEDVKLCGTGSLEVNIATTETRTRVGLQSSKKLTTADSPTIVVNSSGNGISAANITFAGSPKVSVVALTRGIIGYSNVSFDLSEGGKVSAESTITGDPEPERYGAIIAQHIEGASAETSTIDLSKNNDITTPEAGIVYSDSANKRAFVAEKDASVPAATAVVENPVKKQTAAKTMFFVKGVASKYSVKYSWNKVDGAASYKLYQAKCGKKFKKIKTTTGLSFTKHHLKRGATYKVYVVAYNKKGKQLAKTPVIHNITTKGGRANATKVTARATASLKVGKTAKLGAKIAKKDSKTTLLWKNHVSAPIRYYSADTSVVRVDAKGNVKAISAGTTKVYSVAPSGVYAVTKIVVESSVPNFIIDSDQVGYYYSTDNGASWTPVYDARRVNIYSDTVKIKFASVTILVNDVPVGVDQVVTFNKEAKTQEIFVRTNWV